MSQEKFKESLLYAFKNYSKDPDPTLIRLLSVGIEKTVGFDHDWGKVFLDIFAKEKFMPNMATIVEHTKKNSDSFDDMTNKQKAEHLVDRYVMYLTGTLKHDEIGDYDHKYYRKRFNCDRYAVQSGAVDLNFKRREWVSIAELDFEVYDRTGELGFMKDNAQLSGNVYPQLKSVEIPKQDPRLAHEE